MEKTTQHFCKSGDLADGWGASENRTSRSRDSRSAAAPRGAGNATRTGGHETLKIRHSAEPPPLADKLQTHAHARPQAIEPSPRTISTTERKNTKKTPQAYISKLCGLAMVRLERLSPDSHAPRRKHLRCPGNQTTPPHAVPARSCLRRPRVTRVHTVPATPSTSRQVPPEKKTAPPVLPVRGAPFPAFHEGGASREQRQTTQKTTTVTTPSFLDSTTMRGVHYTSPSSSPILLIYTIHVGNVHRIPPP